MDGRLEPGTAVSIDGTARELDVSPTPVREALARLEHTGMVRRVALKGYRVAPVFTREDFAELMEARLAIEPVNARLACARLTPGHLAELAQAVADLKEAPRGPSFAEFRGYLEADERFHRLIAEQTGNQFMVAAYAALGGQIQRFRLFGGVGITDAEHAIAEHQAVLDALARATRRRPQPPWPSTCKRCAAAPSRTLPRNKAHFPGCRAVQTPRNSAPHPASALLFCDPLHS